MNLSIGYNYQLNVQIQVKAPRVNLRPQVEIPKINGRIAGHVEYMVYIAMAQTLQQVNKENTVIPQTVW